MQLLKAKMLELLQEDRQLVKHVEIPQNSGSGNFKRLFGKMDNTQEYPQICDSVKSENWRSASI